MSIINLETELPFSSVGALVFQSIFSNGTEIPSFDSYSSMYFRKEDFSDRFDSHINPDNFLYEHDIDCKYYDFDDNLTKALEHKNDLTLSIISLNICSVPKHLEEFKLDFSVE